MNENIQSIFLIGFMGSGKSTLGHQLSKLLSFQFVDLDKKFNYFTGKSIQNYFNENGEDAFRKKESELLRDINLEKKTVVACGGGTPCYHNNIEWINDNGLSVYLKIPVEFLYARLKNSKASRPLIHSMDNKSLEKYLREELSKREQFYKKSKMTISGAVAPEQLKEQIVQYFEYIALYKVK